MERTASQIPADAPHNSLELSFWGPNVLRSQNPRSTYSENGELFMKNMAATNHRSRVGPEHGLTLIELMVTLALVGIMIAIGFMGTSALMRQLATSGDIRNVATLVREVRLEAMRRKESAKISFDGSGVLKVSYGDKETTEIESRLVSPSTKVKVTAGNSTVLNQITFDGLGLVRDVTSPLNILVSRGETERQVTLLPNGRIEINGKTLS